MGTWYLITYMYTLDSLQTLLMAFSVLPFFSSTESALHDDQRILADKGLHRPSVCLGAYTFHGGVFETLKEVLEHSLS